MQSNFRYLVYDIETVTDKSLLQKVLYPELEGDSEGAYQKQLTELAEAGRSFINPSFHRPISIAVVALTEDYEISKIGILGKDKKDTRSIVEHYWETYNQSRPTLIDFNGKGFDLRVLELWAFRLGIPIRPSHYEKFGPRYKFNEDNHLDLHDFLTNYGAIRLRGGLNLFSKILGKPGKMGTSGDMVQELYDQGKQFEIDNYCLCDAMDTYFVFLRTLVMRSQLDLSREKDLVEAARGQMEGLKEKEGYLGEYIEKFGQWDPEQA